MKVITDESTINELFNKMLDQALRVAIIVTYMSKLIIFAS
jgi:hypothetical protein